MARGDFPSSKQDQFVLRLPEGFRDQLKADAEINNRSMNAEIVARLEEHQALEAERHRLQNDLVIARAERAQADKKGVLIEDRLRQADAREAQLNHQLRDTQNENVALREQVKEVDSLRARLGLMAAELDAKKDELSDTLLEKHKLAKKLESLQFELRIVREKLAFEEGKSASFAHALSIFMTRLVGSEADTSGLLTQIMDDIQSAKPPKG